MSEIGRPFTLDMTDFEKGLAKATEGVTVDATKVGMASAGLEALRDAAVHPPQAPFDEGHLWGSRQVGKVAMSIATPASAGNEVELGKDGGELSIGFNVPYAARWHEVPEGKHINWTIGGNITHPGPKYLESKFVRFKKKYLDLMGLAIKNFLEKGRP